MQVPPKTGLRAAVRRGRTRASSRVRAMSPEALRASWQNPALRSRQSAMVVFTSASWAYKVGLAVYAYHVGGTAGVAVAALIRSLPAALFGPAVGALGDRHSRSTLMAGGNGLIVVTLS